MNTTQIQNNKHEMIENIMKLHQCSNCSIRCRAVAKPRSVFARIHRWHMAWWPGWKIYQRELRARNGGSTTRN
jgi:hypothetical protein